MPQNEDFWNPYRWVTVNSRPPQTAPPSYHHCASGLAGRLDCELEALTPLLIDDGNGKFVRYKRQIALCYIPGTSLKGMLRSLAEVISNSAPPWTPSSSDITRLDMAARMFGFQNPHAFRGLVRFSDASMVSNPTHPWTSYDIVVGSPQRQHRAFYPPPSEQHKKHKFYHHHPGATGLTRPDPGITQTRTVQPAPCGTRFEFTVEFANLRSDELGLLLYCLTLEEQVEVTLGTQALGPANRNRVTFKGPLRHKLGGAKPQGAGSVHIRIREMQFRRSLSGARDNTAPEIWTEEDRILSREIDRRTQTFLRTCDDHTMRELRAMMIYSEQDPRKDDIRYPSYKWFNENSNSSRKLKPTL